MVSRRRSEAPWQIGDEAFPGESPALTLGAGCRAAAFLLGLPAQGTGLGCSLSLAVEDLGAWHVVAARQYVLCMMTVGEAEIPAEGKMKREEGRKAGKN